MNLISGYIFNTIYLAIYLLMAPVILYRRLAHGRSLGSFRQRFFGLVPCTDQSANHIVWLHAVSVGEVNLLGTLLDSLKQAHPNSSFAISTTTATGMKLARQKFAEHSVFYFPIDFTWAMENAIRRVRPNLIVLAELELWPNQTMVAQRKRIPVVVVNGRLSESSFRGYQQLRLITAPVFRRLSMVLAQSPEDALRFQRLGVPAKFVRSVGSMKFDGALVTPDPEIVKRLRESIGLQSEQKLWVAGSTQEPEEAMVAKIWSAMGRGDLRLVIVPRHPHRATQIVSQLRAIGVASQRSSERTEASLPVEMDTVFVADTIGELRAWWSLANIAFVGGSFGDRGGQNMLEPAALDCAVSFGPNIWNFKMIVKRLLARNAAVQVESEKELELFVRRCLSDARFADNLKQASMELIRQSQGAVAETCEHLNGHFPGAPNASLKNKTRAA